MPSRPGREVTHRLPFSGAGEISDTELAHKISRLRKPRDKQHFDQTYHGAKPYTSLIAKLKQHLRDKRFEGKKEVSQK